MNPVVPREIESQLTEAPQQIPGFVILKGNSADVGNLPAMLIPGEYFETHWEPTFDERKAILDGARIILRVMSPGHPPVALGVEGVDA